MSLLELDLYSFKKNENIGKINVLDNIFALEPRVDIIKRVVDWQLINRIAGTRGVKNLSEVSGTGKKPYAQKGTGRARLGTLRAPQLRGGAVAHDVSKNSRTRYLSKKIRFLGLAHALSMKLSNGKLKFINSFDEIHHSTRDMLEMLRAHGSEHKSYLLIDGPDMNESAYHACKNLPFAQVLSVTGMNVYDILKYDLILMSTKAVTVMENRAEKLYKNRDTK